MLCGCLCFGREIDVPVLSAKHAYAPQITSQLGLLLSGVSVQMPGRVSGMSSLHKVQYPIEFEMLVQLIDAKCIAIALKTSAMHLLRPTHVLCTVLHGFAMIACILPLPHCNSGVHQAFYQALKIKCILGYLDTTDQELKTSVH